MKRFFLQSTILTIIILLIGALVYSTFLQPYYNILLPITLILFYCATNLVHAYLLKIAVNSGARFNSKYMAVNFIKMFLYLLIAVAVAFSMREYAKVFLVNFLAGYLIFTTFEVVQFSKFVRQKKE
jgi:hypothetical protein